MHHPSSSWSSYFFDWISITVVLNGSKWIEEVERAEWCRVSTPITLHTFMLMLIRGRESRCRDDTRSPGRKSIKISDEWCSYGGSMMGIIIFVWYYWGFNMDMMVRMVREVVEDYHEQQPSPFPSRVMLKVMKFSDDLSLPFYFCGLQVTHSLQHQAVCSEYKWSSSELHDVLIVWSVIPSFVPYILTANRPFGLFSHKKGKGVGENVFHSFLFHPKYTLVMITISFQNARHRNCCPVVSEAILKIREATRVPLHQPPAEGNIYTSWDDNQIHLKLSYKISRA